MNTVLSRKLPCAGMRDRGSPTFSHEPMSELAPVEFTLTSSTDFRIKTTLRGQFNYIIELVTDYTSIMVREHGSLTKDEETNQAAWEAARGALVGGTKVCTYSLHQLS
jgi:hypothetical protein